MIGDNRASPVSALRNVADAIEAGDTVEGADLDRVLDVLLAHRPSDPFSLRALLLRQYWDRFYPAAPMCAAAGLIAGDWKVMRRGGFVEPGSREDLLLRMEEIGFRPASKSTIIRYLDPALRPSGRR